MKKWLTEHFLPMWAKETVLADTRQLRTENEHLQQKLRELNAYADGLQTGMKCVRHVRFSMQGGKE